MPLFKPKSLLESAQGGAQTKRYRDFVVAGFEGEGAIAVPNAVWLPAASWANGRQPGGNRLRDRTMLLQRLDVLVTRRGTTVCSTTGGMVPLARLRNAMRSEGVDLKEWNFPPDSVLDNALDPEAAKKEEEQEQAAADAGPESFVRVDGRRVRSSRGYEVRVIDPASFEYRHGERVLAVRGVPGNIGGRGTLLLRPEACAGWSGDPGAAQVLANFIAALAFHGIRVSIAGG